MAVNRFSDRIDPAYVVMKILFPRIDGLELIRPPVLYAHLTWPFAVFTANSRPSVAPKYAVFPITTGDDSTFAPGRSSCQSFAPFERASAVTVPLVDETITRSPAIAGVDGFGPCPWLIQSTLPVVASIAYVRPLNVFT